MGSACEIFRRQFGWKFFVYIHLLCRTFKEKLKIQGHHPFKVVICGKYINLNKITKIHISPSNLTDFLFLLFSTVYNAK